MMDVTDGMRNVAKQKFQRLLQQLGSTPAKGLNEIVDRLEKGIYDKFARSAQDYQANIERKVQETQAKLVQHQQMGQKPGQGQPQMQQQPQMQMQAPMQPQMHMGMQQGVYPGFPQQVPQQQQPMPSHQPMPPAPNMGDMGMNRAPSTVDGGFSEFLNVFMDGEGDDGSGQQMQQQMGAYGMSQPQGMQGRQGSQQFGMPQPQSYQQQSYPQQMGMGMGGAAQQQYGGASGTQQWGQQMPNQQLQVQQPQGMGNMQVPGGRGMQGGYPMQQQQQQQQQQAVPAHMPRVPAMPQPPMPQQPSQQQGMAQRQVARQPGMAPAGGMPGTGMQAHTPQSGGQSATTLSPQQIAEYFWRTQGELRAKYLDGLKMYYSRLLLVQQKAAHDPNVGKYNERLTHCKVLLDVLTHTQGDPQAPEPNLDNLKFLHRMKNSVLKQLEHALPKLQSTQQPAQASAPAARNQQREASGATPPLYTTATPPLQPGGSMSHTPTPGQALPAATPPADLAMGAPQGGMAPPPAVRPPPPTASIPGQTPTAAAPPRISQAPGQTQPAAAGAPKAAGGVPPRPPGTGAPDSGTAAQGASIPPAPTAPPQAEPLAAVLKILGQESGGTLLGTLSAPCAVQGMLDMELSTPPLPASLHLQGAGGCGWPGREEPTVMRAVGLCHVDGASPGMVDSDVSATDMYSSWLLAVDASSDEDDAAAGTGSEAVQQAEAGGRAAGSERRKRQREQCEQMLQQACVQVEASLGGGLQLQVLSGAGSSPLGSNYVAVEVTVDLAAMPAPPAAGPAAGVTSAKRLKVCVPCNALVAMQHHNGGLIGAGARLEEVPACPVFPSTDAGYDEHVPGSVRALLQALLEREPARGLAQVVAAWRSALHSTMGPADARWAAIMESMPPRASRGGAAS